MPTYGYACEQCGYEFDEFQSIKAKPLRKCPKCSKPALRRLIGTGAGIIFKGSGFYQTDYRSESYKKAAEKDNGGAKTADKKDTKAETKTTSKEARSSSAASKKKSA